MLPNIALYVPYLRGYWTLARPWSDAMEFCVEHTLSKDHGAQKHESEPHEQHQAFAATSSVSPGPEPMAGNLRKHSTAPRNNTTVHPSLPLPLPL